MIASLTLLLLAGVLGRVAAPALQRSRWPSRAPGWAVLAWLALVYAVVSALLLAGLAALLAHQHAAHGVSGFLHACTEVFDGHYDSFTGVAVGTTGLLTVAIVLVRLGRAGALQRRRRAATQHLLRRAVAAAGAESQDPRGFVEVPHDLPVVCCLASGGLRRGGVVVVSSAALSALSTEQLAVVLAHERAHLRSRHHLALLLVSTVAEALSGRLGTATAHDKVAELVEMHADDAVPAGQRVLLASALLALADADPGVGEHLPVRPAGVLGVGATAVAARVRRMVASPLPPSRRQRLVLGCSVATTALVPFVVAVTPTIVAALDRFCHLPTGHS